MGRGGGIQFKVVLERKSHGEVMLLLSLPLSKHLPSLKETETMAWKGFVTASLSTDQDLL